MADGDGSTTGRAADARRRLLLLLQLGARAATGWTEAPELLLLLRHYLKKMGLGGLDGLPPPGGKKISRGRRSGDR